MNEFGKHALDLLLREDPEMEFKIDQNIEMYRKGFGTIRLRKADGSPVEHARITLHQTGHEFQFGANLFMLDAFPSEEMNERFKEEFRAMFNLAVIPFYWKDLELEDGKPRFSAESPRVPRRPPPLRCLDFCRSSGIAAKGHPLCWHDYWPDWVDKDPRKAMGRLIRRIEEISRVCGDRVETWDVMNEAQTRNWLEKTWMPRLPRGYIEELFRTAERCFPAAKLMYNDDNRWWNHQSEYSPVRLLLERLLREKCRVDGFGMQFHLFEHLFPELEHIFNPAELYACFDMYAELGLNLSMSEISILGGDAYFGKEEGEVFQRIAAERLYRIWFSHPAMRSIVWWNIVCDTACSDVENQLQAGLFDRELNPRPAALAIRDLIRKEWHTDTGFDYRNGAANKFHGFYGDYDWKVDCDEGTFRGTLQLAKESWNLIDIKLEDPS